MLSVLLFLSSLLAVVPAAHAADAKASELMEKGVYSEETKGDLDAAMQFYRQVIAEADAGQALGAQAQFRLAMCYDKKGDRAAATAACEKLIRDYPGQKELVTRASEYLTDGAALLAAPWSDGEELQFDLRLPTGFKIGFGRYTVKAGEIDGHKTWRFGSLIFANAPTWSQLDVEAGSMKPIHDVWKNRMLGAMETSYSPGRADLKVKGNGQSKAIDLTGIVYDNDECLQLMRRLPLAPGYSTTVSLFVAMAGGVVVPVQLSVSGPEKVHVPAGDFNCYKVDLNIKQTLWYAADAHRYLVKFEAGGMVAELTSARSGGAGQPVHVKEPTLGYSVTAPTGWLVNHVDNLDDAKRPTLLVVDPDGISVTFVKVEPLKDFDAAPQASVRAFAEHQIGENKKYVKEFTVRADSWKETTVAGSPAVSIVADHVKNNVRSAMLGVFSFVDGNAVDISCFVSPEDAESFRPELEALVASFKGK